MNKEPCQHERIFCSSQRFDGMWYWICSTCGYMGVEIDRPVYTDDKQYFNLVSKYARGSTK